MIQYRLSTQRLTALPCSHWLAEHPLELDRER
jgi:hypothetical protein